MIAPAWLMVLQAVAPPQWVVEPAVATVGDTVHLVATIAAPPRVRIEPGVLASTDLIEVLEPPAIGFGTEGIHVTYAVAVFEPGEHTIAMPAFEVVRASGETEVLDGGQARMRVASVLPAAEAVEPRPSLGPYRLGSRSPLPAAVLSAATAVVLLVWAVRRRRVRVPRRRSETRSPPPPPLDQWMAAGESRAVATYVADRARRVLEEVEPAAGRHLDVSEAIAVLGAKRSAWPVAELADVLRTLDRSRFAPAAPADVLDVIDRLDGLLAEVAAGGREW